MADDKPLDTRSLRLDLTVPCDERFRPVLSQMCEQMARYVGYRDHELAELAAAVVRAADGALAHAEAPAYRSLAGTILTSVSEIEFRVRYHGENPSGERGAIERMLSHRQGDDAPLEAMQRVMRRVEFGLDEGVEFCALSQALAEGR